jgi:hypothetical protein
LPILDRSPSHSRGNNYFDRPLPQSAFDWEDFSADVRLLLKGTPPHRRDTILELRGGVTQEAIEKLIQLLKLMQDTYELQEAENLPF